jgi:peroxiredoxin
MATQMRSTSEGQVAPDFTLNDVNDKPVALSSFRGKVVLLDFWASWCGPCRKENPNVVAAYNKFHSKGLEILGVSLDDNKSNWQQAIAKDGLTWTHVSDLEGWQSKAAQLYGVQSIPANFLLDKDGKIIAKDLRGEMLEQKLNTLFP